MVQTKWKFTGMYLKIVLGRNPIHEMMQTKWKFTGIFNVDYMLARGCTAAHPLANSLKTVLLPTAES